jgi:hypothetical protein
MYSGMVSESRNGSNDRMLFIKRDPDSGCGYDLHAACRRSRNCAASGSNVRE